MDSFLKEFEDGLQGKNLGLPVGIPSLDDAINGLQRKQIIGLAAPPKAGKSALALFSFLIHPYLYSIDNDVDIDFIFFSLEMDLNQLRYRVAAFFFYYDYGIKEFTHNGKIYPISANYLLSKLKDENDFITVDGRKVRKPIIPNEEHQRILHEIHEKRLVPMFGEYNGHVLVKPGKVRVIVDSKEANPTGIRNFILNYAKENGRFLFEEYETTNEAGVKVKRQRLSGYEPKNPEKYTIIFIDHLRKMPIERGFTIKQNIDKMLEYQVQLRNLCSFTFIDIIHMNRGLANVDRMKHVTDRLFPTPEDIKDTGNVSEEADMVITMMDPTDERYKLAKHFDMPIANYPKYRSIHLVESRTTEAPMHLRVNFTPGINWFETLIPDNELISTGI